MSEQRVRFECVDGRVAWVYPSDCRSVLASRTEAGVTVIRVVLSDKHHDVLRVRMSPDEVQHRLTATVEP